jgi:hypothetical protein
VHSNTVCNQRGNDVARNMLVIKRDDIDPASKLTNGLDVTIVPHRGGCEGRGRSRDLGQHSEIQAEFDSGADHHARQLAATDHTNYCHFRLVPSESITLS